MGKIVILEDDAASMSVFRAMLSWGGYEPLSARTCLEVQQHLAGGGVDALVLDVFVSGQWCHGTDMALRAQAGYPGIKVMFVSGTAFGDWDEADQRNVAALAEASWDVLQKPFTPPTLISSLKALSNRPGLPAAGYPCCPQNRRCGELNPPGTGLPL